MKWCEITRNTNFGHKVCGAKRNGHCGPPKWCRVRNETDVLDLKECIKIFQVVCLESYYSEIFNQMHADTSFRNGSGALMKWRETFESIVWTPIVYIACFQVLSGCLQWSLNCYRSSFSFTLACHRSSLVKKVSLWKKM